MSVTKVTSQMQHFDYLQCKCCNAVLPIAAVFCGHCGMRVDDDETYGSNTSLSGQGDIAARYRITSLIRRRPAIQLSFAWDTRLQRLIMLRDIDISGLDEATKKLASLELQQEYDLLRRQAIRDVMPLIASHYYKDHLYSIAGWPFSRPEGEAVISNIPFPRPYTLHDLLQSGIGLPNEQIAISWIAELAQAVERLHEYQIIIGELDPDTIIVSSHDYSGRPALMVSWLPAAVRHALLQVSPTVYPSSFRFPETLYGQEDRLTDIYSLGALLYLLLIGTAPDPIGSSNPKRHRMRSPRVLNPHISRALDAIVMQALALEPDKRFQRASELGEALLDLEQKVPIVRRSRISFARSSKLTPKLVGETPVSSDMDNNESKRSQEILPIQESNDETIRIEDTQQLLVRSYWSRIDTGPLSSQEKPIGEATVDEVQIQDKQIKNIVDNAYILNDALSENPNDKVKRSKKPIKALNRKSRGTNEYTPEVVSSPEAPDEIVQVAILSAQVVENPAESANTVSLLEAATEELPLASSSESTAEIQASGGLLESDLSTEEVLHQETSIDTEHSQKKVDVEEEVAMEQKQVGERKNVLSDQVQIMEEESSPQELDDVVEEFSTEQDQLEIGKEVIINQGQVEEEEERVEQGLVGIEEEVTIEQGQVEEEEERAEQGLVGIEGEVTIEQGQVEEEEERAEQGLVGIEEEVTIEQGQVKEEEERAEQGLVGIEGEITIEQGQVEAEEDVIAKQGLVGIEENVTIEQGQVKEEEVRAEQGLVEIEEKFTIEQGQVEVEEDVIAKQEQIRKEESSQQKSVEAGKDVIAEQVEEEEKVTPPEEKHQPEEAQEGQAVSTSQALVPQSILHSGMLPVLLPQRSKTRALARIKDLFISTRALLAQQIQLTEVDTDQDASFFQRVQRFILGEQKHTTMAAALIETPMRIQPTQSYAIRIQIIGRDQLKDETQTGGLTALMCGDIVHIEVRLALYQSYAYMVQQADIVIPASGYAAEVTVPMHPLSSGPASRRERLQIFFMDKERNPLYEKPFVVELFISPLVRLGHEGHNVLSIPI